MQNRNGIVDGFFAVCKEECRMRTTKTWPPTTLQLREMCTVRRISTRFLCVPDMNIIFFWQCKPTLCEMREGGGAHLNILDNSSAGLLPTSNTIIPAPFLDTLDKGGTALSRDRSWSTREHHDTIQDCRVLQKHYTKRKTGTRDSDALLNTPLGRETQTALEGKIYNPEL
jgi:hypothetical protein